MIWLKIEGFELGCVNRMEVLGRRFGGVLMGYLWWDFEKVTDDEGRRFNNMISDYKYSKWKSRKAEKVKIDEKRDLGRNPFDQRSELRGEAKQRVALLCS